MERTARALHGTRTKELAEEKDKTWTSAATRALARSSLNAHNSQAWSLPFLGPAYPPAPLATPARPLTAKTSNRFFTSETIRIR